MIWFQVCPLSHVQLPGKDKAVKVNPLLLGYPSCTIEPFCCLQDITIKALDKLLF